MSAEMIAKGLAANPGHALEGRSDIVVMVTDMSELHVSHHFLMMIDSSTGVAPL